LELEHLRRLHLRQPHQQLGEHHLDDPGDKTITATNTSCAGATGGTRSISLGDSSFLSANFSFSPGSPPPTRS